MADKRADLAAKKAAELDRELDEYIESLKKKADGKLRKPEVTEENWQEEFEKVPAFMTKTPTQEEIDSNPALAALQALKYEDDDPVAKAEAYKEDGNYAYKNKKFHDAIVAYTEGIKAKCNNVELNAILYTNRATAQWCLGNYRSAINDATVARKLQPTYMKAILRGASACVEVQRYDEALKWCDDGLAIEPVNKKLLDLRNKSVAEQKRVQRDQRKAMIKEKKEKSKVEALLSAVKDRGVHLEHQDDLTRSISDGGLDVKVHLDTDGVLHWPVLFVYPEFNQTDLISSFNENDRISDHLHTMFEVESPPWDVEKKYKPESLEVYFEDASSEKLCLVKNNKCLKDVLSDSRLLVRERTPSFIILSKESSFRTIYLQRYQVER
ncbi:tetratricopeptide repeat protein 4-like [Porites lutea]|uniref:tetratricopeptide repeat protein 4-like n=1 Tax=Porites lutea TaxID=51062 RepID=UPI003CC50811